MTKINLYSDIGPFRGIPHDLASRIANKANAAASGAYAAARRKAPQPGPAYFQAPDVINALDDKFFEDKASSRTSARIDLFGSLTVTVPMVAFGLVVAVKLVARGQVLEGLVAAAAAAVFGAFMWFFAGRNAWKSLRELREKGYLDDDLPQDAEGVAGRCWLLGSEAVVIARKSDNDYRTTTVFYDAMAGAEVRIEEGREVVDIVARTGETLASLVSPVSEEGGSATSLVWVINESVRKARAPA